MADVLDTTEVHEQHELDEDVGVAVSNETVPVVSLQSQQVTTVSNDTETEAQGVTTDILQQAFVEASGGEITHIDEEQGDICLSPEKQQQIVEELETSAVVDVDDGQQPVSGGFESIVSSTLPAQSESQQLDAASSNNNEIFTDGDGAHETTTTHSSVVVTNKNDNSGSTNETSIPIENDASIQQHGLQESFAITTTTNSQSVAVATPLGSKNNPIRIIQQGNTYKSTQKLSPDQIQQIVQVLQKQNLTTKTVDGGPTAVYNPETNTRIVYRVVQPHAKIAQKDGQNSTSGAMTARDYHLSKYGSAHTGRGRGRPK